jgi:hypothetical protein
MVIQSSEINCLFSFISLDIIFPTVYVSLNSSPNIIRMIKIRRRGCSGHVAVMGEKWKAYKVLMRSEGKNSSEKT